MKALVLTFNLLCAGDSATTAYALHTQKAVEAVWPIQNPGAAVAVNTGQCVAVSYAGMKLPRKVGIPVLLVGIAARGWAVSHNLRELH
jgi:hypothetical protein